jgi:Ca2+-transporting ATPase
MGNKGTEIAKAAAALIITNDDLGKLVTAIAAGRRIYSNIKKAIQYIISIHIPIILTVSLPLFLGWVFPHILTPVHVIFLELIMGPTLLSRLRERTHGKEYHETITPENV